MDFGRIIKNFFFLLVAIFSGLTLVLITVSVTSGTELNPFNNAVESLVAPFRSPFMKTIMVIITNIGGPYVLTILATFLAIYLLLHSDTYDALLYLVSIFFSIISFVILKNTFHLARPAQDIIADLSSWTYPSGHATVSTAFFFATGYSFFSYFKTVQAKAALIFVCVVSPVLVSLTRLYLREHFALDVLAGISLGLFSVSFTALMFNLFLSEREWWRRHFKSF
jgi:undecaprenyl-diphosphatase